MAKLFFNICFFLDPSRKDKCDEFLNEIFLLISYTFHSKLFFAIAFFFLLILIGLIFSQYKSNYNIYILPFLIFCLFFFILNNFSTNLPWVDDWEWMENLQTKEISTFQWLFQKANIHNIFLVKLFFLINNYFFDLNFELFNYLSIIIIFLISLIFIKNEKIENKIYLSLFIILIFSGKQFANFSQASNIAWTICFFYIISFKYFFESDRLISVIFCSIIIFIAPLTFGLGYVLPLYVLTFIYFNELKKKVKLFYMISALSGITISYLIPKLIFSDLDSNILDTNYLKILVDSSFYFTFFGVLANVYLPWIEGFAYAGVLIGFVQILIIFVIQYKKINQNIITSIKNFIKNNFFIILGLIFALIVSLTRSDFQTIVAARYVVGSIIFQIGFWLFIFNETKINYGKNFNLIKLVTLYLFLSGILFPYHGIHWQVKRHFLNNKITDCYKKNIQNLTNCNKFAYDILFYGGKWYNYEIFGSQIQKLKDNNKSFLSF